MDSVGGGGHFKCDALRFVPAAAGRRGRCHTVKLEQKCGSAVCERDTHSSSDTSRFGGLTERWSAGLTALLPSLVFVYTPSIVILPCQRCYPPHTVKNDPPNKLFGGSHSLCKM